MIIIIIINYQNCSGMPRKFSRSWMTKRTAPLNSSLKSSDPEKFHRILRQSEFFYEFLGDKSSVTRRTRFLRKSHKSINSLS